MRLKDKLVAERPGILADLIVRGKKVLAASGIEKPALVVLASRAYIADRDDFGVFWEKCVAPSLPTAAGIRTKLSDVADAYNLWARENGVGKQQVRQSGLAGVSKKGGRGTSCIYGQQSAHGRCAD